MKRGGEDSAKYRTKKLNLSDVALDKENPSKTLLKKNKPSVDFETISYTNDKIKAIITSTSAVDDSTITFKDEKIPVSKSNLADTCQYFQMRLKHCFQDDKSDNLYIKVDVSVATFKQILDYLKTGTIELSTRNLDEVTEAASFLLLEDLKKVCLDLYKKNIDCESVDRVHTFADEYNFDGVSKAAFAFKVTHFEAIWRSDVFRSWKLKYIQEILRSDLVVVSEEKKVVKFLFEWLTVDVEKRSENATGLLQKLRYSFLTKANLVEVTKLHGSGQFVKQLFDIFRRFSGRDTPPRVYHKGIYMIGNNSKTNSNGEWKFEQFSPDDGTVKSLQPPEGDQFRLAVNNDRIYAICRKSGICQVYDPIKDIWSPRASMGRHAHFFLIAVCSFENEIFAFYVYKDGENDCQTAGMIYAVETDAWKPLPVAVPPVKYISSITTCGDSIYLVGFNCSRNPNSKMLQYTPSTQVWSEIPSPSPSPLLDTYQVVAYNYKLVFTNHQLSATTKGMLVFCTKAKSFKEFTYTNPGDRLWTTVYNKSLYIVNRSRDEGILKVETIDPVFMEVEGDPVPIPLSDWKSAFRHGEMICLD